MAKDPVCGAEVDEQQARAEGLTSDYQGHRFVFCSADCKARFEAEPQRYISQPTRQPG